MREGVLKESFSLHLLFFQGTSAQNNMSKWHILLPFKIFVQIVKNYD